MNFFLNEEDALSVTIDTDRLHIKSVTDSESDIDSYAKLFGSTEVMRLYAAGKTKTKEEIETRIKESWVKRWKGNDPYRGLAVFRNDTDDFLGHVVLGYGEKPGQSEMAYLFMQQHWRKGYGSEAVNALVEGFAPATIQQGYLLQGKPLEEITATTRPDNPASLKILEKLAFKKVGEEEKFGHQRFHLSKKV